MTRCITPILFQGIENVVLRFMGAERTLVTLWVELMATIPTLKHVEVALCPATQHIIFSSLKPAVNDTPNMGQYPFPSLETLVLENARLTPKYGDDTLPEFTYNRQSDSGSSDDDEVNEEEVEFDDPARDPPASNAQSRELREALIGPLMQRKEAGYATPHLIFQKAKGLDW